MLKLIKRDIRTKLNIPHEYEVDGLGMTKRTCMAQLVDKDGRVVAIVYDPTKRDSTVENTLKRLVLDLSTNYAAVVKVIFDPGMRRQKTMGVCRGVWV